jgi:hypothetical protein
MKVYGLLVMRNEESRYLEHCLSWMVPIFDEVFVFDDQSTDSSAEIALDHGCRVVVRPDQVPSFMTHEGLFRLASWKAFMSVVKPKADQDWVLSFDADEFLVSDSGDTRQAVDLAVNYATRKNRAGVVLPVPEIFKVDESGHYSRTDGYWGNIRGPRLFEIRDNATWRQKAMGCGSEPEYVVLRPPLQDSCGLHLLHYGYAKDEDKKLKYERYASIDHGHNDSHINSIIKKPTLELWRGPTPEVGL